MQATRSNQEAATTPAVESSKESGSGKASRLTTTEPIDTAVRDALKAQALPAYDAVCLAWSALNRERSIAHADAYAAALKSCASLLSAFVKADKADPSAQIMQSRTITVITAIGSERGAFDVLVLRWIGGGATVSQFRSGSMKAARSRVR